MHYHTYISRFIRKFIKTKYVLEKSGIGILTETKNGLFVVEVGDYAVGSELLRKGEYDYSKLVWLKKSFTNKPKNIVVVGTHIGALLVPLSKICDSIYGFEADYKTYTLLKHNLLLNKVHNAEIYNIAVSNKKGVANVIRNPINTGMTKITSNNINSGNSIETTTLDDFFCEKTIDMLVMDIEGNELNALKGAKQTLKKIEKIYIEFSPIQLRSQGSDPIDLLNILKSHYSFIYEFENNTFIEYDIIQGIDKIIKEMNKKRYLKDFLFAKSKVF